MRVFSYIVVYDFGFAPNPIHGVLTLATCKPAIRRAATVGDWVVGTGAASNKRTGQLVYAMRVGEAMSFDQYWEDPRFQIKKPIPNGSLKLMYGDNIYHHDAKGRWAQADSHHSRPGGKRHLLNVGRDTLADRVLIADKFAYYGEDAIEVPKRFRDWGTEHKDVCIGGVGQRKFEGNFAGALARWLEALPTGIVGFPAEFRNHPKATSTRRDRVRKGSANQGRARKKA